MAEPDSDEALMLQFQAGISPAFEILYSRHKGGVYRYLLRQGTRQPMAEELAQDVWLNLIRARASYVPSAKFTTYVYRLAHNRLIDHFRAGGKVSSRAASDEDEEVENLPAPASYGPEAHAVAAEQGRRMKQAIRALPQHQREAFVLQQESDLSVEEIAALTGVSFETAKSRLRYASAKLRADLKDLL